MTELELLTAAHNLPDDVREQLSSVRTTAFMIDLNARLNIKGDRQRIISVLVRRLVVRDLQPQDFLSELAIQLNISDSSAKIIVKEIEEKVLHPIEDSLRDNAEVDVALLHFGKEVSGELPKVADLPVAEAAAPTQAEKPKPVIETERHIEARVAAPTARPSAPSGPFILHSEKDEIKPVAEAQKSRPTFSIKIPITQKKYYSATPTVRARIETPADGTQIDSSLTLRMTKGEAGNGKSGTPVAPPPLRKLSEIAMATTEQEPRTKNQEPNDAGMQPQQEPRTKSQEPNDAGMQPQMDAPQKPTAGARLQISNGSVKIVQPKIQKVVHYSDFFTKL